MDKPLVEAETEKTTSKVNRVTKKARSATKYNNKPKLEPEEKDD